MRRDWAENLKNTLGFVVLLYIDLLKWDWGTENNLCID